MIIENQKSKIENPILRLAPSVVNKIAAGEVIERPASVVKELLENAIDAGATRIEVSIENGGSELVRVSDNGGGIDPEQLELAVASHATSKIRDAEDLFRVSTLGFRGEALASIAEVSQVELRSRTADRPDAQRIEVVAGTASDVSPCGCPPGTTVEVRRLFFNTPVRRKFLKTDQTELGHITEMLTRLALAHPQIHFTLRHNNRLLHDLPATDDWSERIERFFGAELAGSLIWVESQNQDVQLRGYVAHPSQSRSHPRMQYLFLNGRCIRDRSLQHALSEAYRGLLLTGRYPISFLRFEMPADLVDVNVHPTKLEVRFQDGGRIYSHLLATLRSKFLGTDLTARLQPVAGDAPPAADESRNAEQVRREWVDWAKGELGRWEPPAPEPAGDGASISVNSTIGSAGMPVRQPLDLVPLPRSWQPPQESAAEPDDGPFGEDVAAIPFASQDPSAPVRALQLHNRYLIAETDEGMVVIDQHALHERILYEQLRQKVLAGPLEAQILLVPETIELSGAEAAAVLEHRELLATLGIKVEAFGGGTLLISSHPAMLARLTAVEVLRALLDQLMSGGKLPDRRDLLDELLHMMSCKAAIKAGDRLTTEEISALVTQRQLVQDSHHCPHGRPTALVFTREELDKQFKRT